MYQIWSPIRLVVVVDHVHLLAGAAARRGDRFQHRAVAVPAAAGVVDLAGPRGLVELPEHVDQVAGVDVVADLLALVAEDRVGLARSARTSPGRRGSRAAWCPSGPGRSGSRRGRSRSSSRNSGRTPGPSRRRPPSRRRTGSAWSGRPTLSRRCRARSRGGTRRSPTASPARPAAGSWDCRRRPCSST